MSLLVFGSANKIAHGVIKRLYGSGAFEQIVCADLYPTYWAHERFLKFREELDSVQSNTKLHDLKIGEKSDLVSAISHASHVVYITHNYYRLAASKLNLIKTTAELSQKHGVKKLVALTPIEHDHYNEQNPYLVVSQSEADAIAAYPNLIHLKSDITFGPHSNVVNVMLSKIVNGEPFYFDNASTSKQTRPIHSDDVAQIVEASLKDSNNGPAQYALNGPSNVTFGEILRKLERHAATHARTNEDWIEKIISPTSVNLISERLYCPSYINFAAFLKNYRQIEGTQFKGIESFGINLKDFNEHYKENSVARENFRNDSSTVGDMVKNFLY